VSAAVAEPVRLARAMVDGAPSVVVSLADGGHARASAGGRSFDDLPALLAACGGDAASIAAGAEVDVVQEDLLSVVGRPAKIVCIGLNYRLHAEEGGVPVPTHPMLFPKWSAALTGPRADVPLPPESEFVDWECELAFVFARRCRRVAAAAADAVVFGYTVANDTSMRDYQTHTTQFAAGKTWEAATPVGPYLVSAAALGGVRPDLAIRGRLNGELVQDSRTDDLIFGVGELVAYLTTIMTMEPGDLVLTGTPAGVGFTADPPRSLHDGDVFEVEIEGLGSLCNRFVREAVAG
jgi:acylpyruvate hydrolase